MNLKFDLWRTKVLAANVLSNAWILLWLILCTGGRAGQGLPTTVRSANGTLIGDVKWGIPENEERK
jgi:hypothetical protein